MTRELNEASQPYFVRPRPRRANADAWKLEDAKAQFSEVVRRARSEGPQRVTVRGKDAVVILSSEEYQKMQPETTTLPLVEYLETLYVEGLDLNREPDRGRDIEL